MKKDLKSLAWETYKAVIECLMTESSLNILKSRNNTTTRAKDLYLNLCKKYEDRLQYRNFVTLQLQSKIRTTLIKSIKDAGGLNKETGDKPIVLEKSKLILLMTKSIATVAISSEKKRWSSPEKVSRSIDVHQSIVPILKDRLLPALTQELKELGMTFEVIEDKRLENYCVLKIER